MPATTLPDAYNEFDPRQRITPEEVDRLFVLRPHSPVARMKTQLQVSNRPLKLLFIGHGGAGKSSELSYLSTLLTDQFLSVFTPLYDFYQGATVNHTEIVFAIYVKLLEQATSEEIMPTGMVTDSWNLLMERIFDPLRKHLFGAEQMPFDKETSITIKLKLLVTELEAKIGTETYTRNQIKEKFEGRVAEILDNIEQLSKLLETHLNKKILLIIEDLDKFNLVTARTLFVDNARTLTAPYPSIIYSLPVAIRYDSNFRGIEIGFSKAYLLPNIALTHRDGSDDDEGRKTMQEILNRRVDPSLFAPSVQEQLISWSGGHVKTLIQIGQQAIINAIVSDAAQVEVEHVEQARKALRNDYMAALKPAQIALLQNVRIDPDKDLDDTTPEIQALLLNSSLLEYENSRGYWANVRPLVVELLDRNNGSDDQS